ncbi:MAG TPA: hypothetical protein VHO84_11965, partial [Syntrophorhabdaceae bacterium]|nr:hypothetical protein [Syntrophorhabdaceae bacterium]
YFGNKRPEITVEKNHEKLIAFASITYENSGLLEAHWEVDGRIVSRVSQYLTYGNKYTFKTPDMAGLPTFDPGTHIVRFVVTAPGGTGLVAPSLLYFVTAQGVQQSRGVLKLIDPSERAFLKYAPLEFTWEPVGGNPTYIIQFYKQKTDTPLFSACTRDTNYRLPPLVVKRFFKSGVKYFWKVKGSNEKEEAESTVREFSFRSR